CWNTCSTRDRRCLGRNTDDAVCPLSGGAVVSADPLRERAVRPSPSGAGAAHSGVEPDRCWWKARNTVAMTSPLRQGIMRTVHPPLEESRVWVVDLLGSTVLRRVLRRMALASMRWCQLSAKQPAKLYGVLYAP